MIFVGLPSKKKHFAQTQVVAKKLSGNSQAPVGKFGCFSKSGEKNMPAVLANTYMNGLNLW